VADIVVREFENEVDGHIARAVLEANDIPARVLVQHVYPGVVGLGSVRLIVRAEDAVRARELLDASD
jgi:hypothetical protein